MKMYITLIIKLSEESKTGPQAGPNMGKNRGRRLEWNFYGGWGGARLRIPTQGLKFPPVSKKGLSRLSYELSQMWVKEEGGWSLQVLKCQTSLQ